MARPVAERAATTGFSPYSKPLTNLPNLDPAILDSMRNEAKQTLTNNPGAYQIANDLLQPSGAEKALGYGGAAATIGGAPQSRERRSTDGRVGPLPLSSTL